MLKKFTSTEFLLTILGIAATYFFKVYFTSFEIMLCINAIASCYVAGRALTKKNWGNRSYSAFQTRELYILLTAFFYEAYLLYIRFLQVRHFVFSIVFLVCIWSISRGYAKSDARIRINAI